MKTAVVFDVPMTTSAHVCWRWRSVDGKTDSTQCFFDRQDCLENAKAHGYYVQVALGDAEVAPCFSRYPQRQRQKAGAQATAR